MVSEGILRIAKRAAARFVNSNSLLAAATPPWIVLLSRRAERIFCRR